MQDTNRPTKYWVVVVSKDHVQKGKSLGIIQANHGKAAPMKRLQEGDIVLLYSPKVEFAGSESLKKFTAAARVKPGIAYESDMGTGFMAYRRDVEYLDCDETEIIPLIPEMTFIRNKKSWGFVFRFGFFEIPETDFRTIAHAMHLKID